MLFQTHSLLYLHDDDPRGGSSHLRLRCSVALMLTLLPPIPPISAARLALEGRVSGEGRSMPPTHRPRLCTSVFLSNPHRTRQEAIRSTCGGEQGAKKGDLNPTGGEILVPLIETEAIALSLLFETPFVTFFTHLD